METNLSLSGGSDQVMEFTSDDQRCADQFCTNSEWNQWTESAVEYCPHAALILCCSGFLCTSQWSFFPSSSTASLWGRKWGLGFLIENANMHVIFYLSGRKRLKGILVNNQTQTPVRVWICLHQTAGLFFTLRLNKFHKGVMAVSKYLNVCAKSLFYTLESVLIKCMCVLGWKWRPKSVNTPKQDCTSFPANDPTLISVFHFLLTCLQMCELKRFRWRRNTFCSQPPQGELLMQCVCLSSLCFSAANSFLLYPHICMESYLPEQKHTQGLPNTNTNTQRERSGPFSIQKSLNAKVTTSIQDWFGPLCLWVWSHGRTTNTSHSSTTQTKFFLIHKSAVEKIQCRI